ncbi:histidinol-phosphate transaminase [Corynebacterium poyangense]|uniref:Histidinol-phosphate aminotransferase n=1 Tax=Corynebacterium poyangense TaxID=2684405 RepID=A0A7H0SLE4_9CORY|nr:histidinol-phosphate transaminase [Corynebacterium poyangense]MBZ8177462.1 histidinol-phosphate transaminase [Corynebacterium poyangense]QNQ89369.1 histidinol-phosphate transaminase [Corynebacterium poyangense]
MIRAEIADMPEYVPGKDYPGAIKLSSNEVTTAPVPEVKEAVMEVLDNPNRYPDMGVDKLRAKIAEFLGLESNQISVGCGSSAICQELVQITCHDGDEVIFPWRSFEAYPIFAEVHGAQPVMVPLTADNGLDLDAMIAAINDRTRLIFVCNPNNPSGSTITTSQFAEFMDKVPEDVVVALDEAYFEYNRAADTPVATEEIARHPNVVGLRTFSKAWGLAGIRVGYAFGAPEIISALNKVCLPFSVNAVAQAAALTCLDYADRVMASTEETVIQRDRVADALGVQRSQANYVWLPCDDPATAPELAERLAEHGVLVRAFPEGLRITVTNRAETDLFLAAWEKIT